MNISAISIKYQIMIKNRFKNISKNFENLKIKILFKENIKKLIYLTGQRFMLKIYYFFHWRNVNK